MTTRVPCPQWFPSRPSWDQAPSLFLVNTRVSRFDYENLQRTLTSSSCFFRKGGFWSVFKFRPKPSDRIPHPVFMSRGSRVRIFGWILSSTSPVVSSWDRGVVMGSFSWFIDSSGGDRLPYLHVSLLETPQTTHHMSPLALDSHPVFVTLYRSWGLRWDSYSVVFSLNFGYYMAFIWTVNVLDVSSGKLI